MFCRDEVRVEVAAAAFGFMLARFASPQSMPQLAGGDARLESALREAAQDAEGKLARPSCQMVFLDFRSLDGHRLQETLDTHGQDGRSYFRGLVFYDGYGRTACATRDIIAFTSPGSRAVFLCPAQFVEKVHRDPGLASALLIHEELHALGLGENPPSSKEITQKVIERCGK